MNRLFFGINEHDSPKYHLATVKVQIDDDSGDHCTIMNGQAAEPLKDGDMVETCEPLPGIRWKKCQSGT